MLVSPYHTLICQMYPVERLRRELQRMDIEYPLPPLTTPAGNVIADAVVVVPRDHYQSQAAFTQFLNLGDTKTGKWVVDGRAYMRWNHRDDSYRLTAENDYSFQASRLALSQVAEQEGDRPFRRLGDLPVKTFVRWITLAVAQRFNLPLEDQIRVSVIVAYYYFTQLNDTREQVEEERHRLANMVSRIVGAPVPTVLEAIDPVGALTDPKALTQAIADHSGNVRLANLKFTDLYMVLASSWIGVNSRENVGVALEHIPTFIAMVYMALGDRSYRKTVITRRAESSGRLNDQKQFVTQVYRLVESRFA